MHNIMRLSIFFAKILIRVEKSIYRHTGYMGAFLRGYWDYCGKSLQIELNKQQKFYKNI